MTILEKAVSDLANALDDLETRLDARLDDSANAGERFVAARGQARSAAQHAEDASRELSGAIDELKGLLSNRDANGKAS